MAFPGRTHDIVIEDFDGLNRRGFMLQRNRRGLRSFEVQDAQTIRPRELTMGELTQAEFPADIEGIWFQENWAIGIGGRTQRQSPDMVQSANRMDLSIKGVMQPARALRNSTLSANPDEFYPTGFAICPPDTDPGDAGVLAEIWAFVGSYAFAGGDDNWTRIHEPQNFNIYYKNGLQYNNFVIAPGLNAGTDVADAPFPYIYKDPQTGTWTVSNITAGRFKFFAKARDNAGVEVLWGAHHIFDTGFTLSGDHDASDTTLDLNSDPTAVISVDDIIMMGAGGSQELMLVEVVSASAPHLTVVRQYGTAAVDPVGGEKIYLYQPNVIKSSRDITNGTGSWTTAVKIGEDDQPITGITTVEDTSEVLIAKTDGLWSYAYDTFERLVVKNLTIEFRQQQQSNNFLGMYSWNNLVFLPLGNGGLMVFNPATRAITDISFRLTIPETLNYHGRVLALSGDTEYLFVMLKDKDSEKIHLLQGTMISASPPLFSWSPVVEMGAGAAIDDNQVGLMVESALDDHRRVWLGITESAVSTTPQFYPFGDVNDDKTDGFSINSNVEAILTRLDANLPRIPKRLGRIELESKNLGVGGRKIGFDYRVDEENFQTGDDFITSPRQEIFVDRGVTGKILELKIKPSQTAISTTAPQMLSIRVTYQIRPDPTRLYPLTIILSDDQQILNGAIESRSRGDRAQLEAWNASPSDVTLYTPDDPKNGKVVLFLPGTLRIRQLSDEVGLRPSYQATFLLAEIG